MKFSNKVLRRRAERAVAADQERHARVGKAFNMHRIRLPADLSPATTMHQLHNLGAITMDLCSVASAAAFSF